MKIIKITVEPTSHRLEVEVHDAKSPGGHSRRWLLFSGKVGDWPKVLEIIGEQLQQAQLDLETRSRPARLNIVKGGKDDTDSQA